MQSGAFLWCGFDHEWMRSVLGFRIPHRISKLDSYITDEHHTRDGSSATLVMGQATGVDGNFMRPRAFATAIWSPDLSAHTAVAELRWTDEIAGVEAPRAESRIERVLELEIAELSPSHRLGAALAGFSLASRCDPAKQPPELPCNSDGMWPYRFAIEVGAASRSGTTVRVPITVECHRGWTPMRGGLPGIEEKPLNRRLDISVSVHVTVLSGSPGALAFSCGSPVLQGGRARAVAISTRRQELAGAGEGAYPRAAVAMTGFGFELLPASNKPRHRHRGRYLGGLSFRVDAADYDGQTGVMQVDHSARVWVPRTVIDSGVRYSTSAALVQLGDGARVTSPIEGRGSICACSAPEAPFFSRWNGCGEQRTGPARLEDRVPLAG